MAIVFISAKEKQKSFFSGLAILAGVFLVAGAAAVFLPGFLNPSQTPTLPQVAQFGGALDVVINFTVLDSDKVKNLEPFTAPIATGAPVGRSDPFSGY